MLDFNFVLMYAFIENSVIIPEIHFVFIILGIPNFKLQIGFLKNLVQFVNKSIHTLKIKIQHWNVCLI